MINLPRAPPTSRSHMRVILNRPRATACRSTHNHAPRVSTPQSTDTISPHAPTSLSPIFTVFCPTDLPSICQTVQSDPAERIRLHDMLQTPRALYTRRPSPHRVHLDQLGPMLHHRVSPIQRSDQITLTKPVNLPVNLRLRVLFIPQPSAHHLCTEQAPDAFRVPLAKDCQLLKSKPAPTSTHVRTKLLDKSHIIFPFSKPTLHGMHKTHFFFSQTNLTLIP